MKIPSHELSRCIQKAKEIIDVYRLKTLCSSDPKRSIDVLIDVCTESSGKPIEVYRGDGDINFPWLNGTCLQFEEKSVILFAHFLNTCWERFTVCKELFHIVLDQDEFRNTDIFQHIQDIILAFPDDASTPTQPVICEFLAEVAAMEFMLPYTDRILILKLKTQSAMDVAHQYKIPCQMVERYLSKDYMASLDSN